MNKGLEKIIDYQSQHSKREGENRIAHFLGDSKMPYLYKSGIQINGKFDRIQILYASSKLPSYAILIEYYRSSGIPEHDGKSKRETPDYKKADFAPTHYSKSQGIWQRYAMEVLDAIDRYIHGQTRSQYYRNQQPQGSYLKGRNLMPRSYG